MPTTREVQAAADERRRREARLYTPDRRGPSCPVCKQPTVLTLANAERNAIHPSCEEIPRH